MDDEHNALAESPRPELVSHDSAAPKSLAVGGLAVGGRTPGSRRTGRRSVRDHAKPDEAIRAHGLRAIAVSGLLDPETLLSVRNLDPLLSCGQKRTARLGWER